MPYSELAQSDRGRTLEEDETGYYDLEWRSVDDIKADLRAKGVDLSDFDARVEICKENLAKEALKGRTDANTILEDAQILALLGYNMALPPDDHVEMRKKVYYDEGASISVLIEQ